MILRFPTNEGIVFHILRHHSKCIDSAGNVHLFTGVKLIIQSDHRRIFADIHLDIWGDSTHTMEWIRSRGIDLKIIENAY